MSIWRNRTVDSDHPEPRRDVGFIIYAVILLSVICLVPIVRLLFLSLVSPSASSVLASPVAERTAFAVAVIVCVTALWGGRFQGPATLPPFLTYALAGSDIPRLLTYRRPLLIAASWVLGMLTAASILVAASMWTTDIIFALDAALVVVSWICTATVVFCLWVTSQTFPRASAVSAILLLLVGGCVLFVPGLWQGWPAEILSSGPGTVIALITWAALAVVGVCCLPRMLEAQRFDDLLKRSIRLAQAQAQVFIMEFGQASSIYREPPRLLRRMKAVRPSRHVWITIAISDLYASLRSPIRLLTSLVCVLGAGLLVGLGSSLGPLAALLGLGAGALSYMGVGPLADGLRHGAAQVSDLPLYGISDRFLISVHAIFPIVVSGVVTTIGGLIGVQLTSGSILQVLVSSVGLSVLTVASILMSALKGPMPVQFLTSVPSPMGDPMVLTRAMWALDGLLTAIAAGMAVAALPTAPALTVVVAGIPLVLILRRWRYRG